VASGRGFECSRKLTESTKHLGHGLCRLSRYCGVFVRELWRAVEIEVAASSKRRNRHGSGDNRFGAPEARYGFGKDSTNNEAEWLVWRAARNPVENDFRN